jgi:myo-inositol 2-dehydrogenase/D-chiro-inositol 1-dehydrogenase
MPAYQRELDHFVDAVASWATPSPSGWDGLLAQRLADAASESARTGRSIKLEG